MQERKFLTVAELVREKKDYLRLQLFSEKAGLDNRIFKTRIQRPGLALAGYTAKLDPERIQILGSTELEYLSSLDEATKRSALEGLASFPLCCILITKGLDPPAGLKEIAEAKGIPILGSDLLSSVVIRRLINYLEDRLADETSLHGTFLVLFGIGVLLMGKSGIGKSECALDLISRGHQLVSDDIIKIRLLPPDILICSGYDLSRHHMEIRGLGIIEVKEIFGVSSVEEEKRLELVVMLEEWRKEGEYERTGLDEYSTEFLGVQVPMIKMPVASGRNMATILEVSVRNYLLKKRGISPAQSFDRQLKALNLRG